MPFSLSKTVHQVIHEAGEVGQYLWQKGWAEKNAGNLSVDVTDHVSAAPDKLKAFPIQPVEGLSPESAGRSYLVTGTGIRYRDIQNRPSECLCVLRISRDARGFHLLWGGKREGFKPTSELPSHLMTQNSLRKSGAKEKVVLHTHPNELIALTHLPETVGEEKLNFALWSMIPEAKIYVPRGIGWVPYRLTASRELAEETVKVLERKHKVVAWEKHGVLAVGKDVFEAFDLVDAMNKAAILYLLCRQTGQTPQGLSREQIDEISRTFSSKD
ncbi:MAG TPA: rhamnulose-1-phosphate aldolase [bacterium]|nr:rhamnulose-1-phosphate aldolase [bacterium]